MPHPIAVDQPGSGRLGDRQHPAVHMVRHSLHHELGRIAQACGPVLTYQIEVSADATRGDNYYGGRGREFADDRARALDTSGYIARLEDRPVHSIDRSIGEQEFVDAVPELERDQAVFLGRAVRRRNGSRTPGPVPHVM